jgi:hypothetical protein
VWGSCWRQRRHGWRVEKPADTATSAISRHCQRSVKIDSRYNLPPNRNNDAVLDALHPLFTLTALQILHVSSSFAHSLDDSWIAQATRAWPRLNTHVLENSDTPLGAPGFTLEGLIPLLKGCPHLTRFGMRFELKPIDTILLKGVRNSRLKRLWVDAGSTLIHPPQVFRSLIGMFSNL